MKFTFFILVVFLFSCEQSKPVDVVEPIKPKVLATTPAIAKKNVEDIPEKSEASIAFKKIKGDYFGEFIAEKFTKKKSPTMKNKIKFSLDKLDDKAGQLFGTSIVAGGKRPFSGPYTFEKGTLKSTLKEPGDDKYDGTFEINVKEDSDTLSGSWVANNEKLAVTKRSFNIKKTTFKYDPKVEVTYNSFMKHLLKYRGDSTDQIEESYYETKNINASTTKLRAKDLENMIQEDLALVRNAIYARHGYAFKTRKYRYYFEREVDWYVPFSTDVREELTSLEKTNIKLLKRYEKHAMEYYDTFGR